MAGADPLVAEARNMSLDVLYGSALIWPTGIFRRPELGGLGYTATGQGLARSSRAQRERRRTGRI